MGRTIIRYINRGDGRSIDKFSWDSEKEDLVRRTRNFDFTIAIKVFYAEDGMDWVDRRDREGEIRRGRMGTVYGRHFTVIYTNRDGGRRIITAWKTRRRDDYERRQDNESRRS